MLPVQVTFAPGSVVKFEIGAVSELQVLSNNAATARQSLSALPIALAWEAKKRSPVVNLYICVSTFDLLYYFLLSLL